MATKAQHKAATLEMMAVINRNADRVRAYREAAEAEYLRKKEEEAADRALRREVTLLVIASLLMIIGLLLVTEYFHQEELSLIENARMVAMGRDF